MEDLALIERERRMIDLILAGDTQLFHALIRPYERSVFLMALSFLRNEADAEDAAQEAFMKGFRKLAQFRGESRFGTWLISIALNEARSRIRRANLQSTQSLDATAEEGAISPAVLRDWREIPSEALEREEVRQILHGAVNRLPAIYREVFLLRDVEGLDQATVATTLDISISNVKVRLHRARIMLQSQLVPLLKTAPAKKRRWNPWS